ncbi:DUF4190 domain-containing protein [Streptomyces sp. NPDC047022]|uniref:DUF4190 domain-containing protein n=1 Tax=Streptomyces sp. NPDC047022 TaxID=3155737 RepID=UPI0033CAD6B0
MADEAHETKRDAAEVADPWAPPGSGTSLSKPSDPTPTVHDMPTMTAMPSADGFVPPQASAPPQAFAPPQGYAPPGFGPATGGPSAGPADGMLPPPPIAPTGPGPGDYSYPAYPNQGWPGAPIAPQNGLGTAAMVLGIISCALFCLYGVVSVITGVIALVLAINARKRVARGEANNPGQAQAGLIMGIIGTVLGVLVIVLFVIGISTALKDHHDDPYDDSYGATRVTQQAVVAR